MAQLVNESRTERIPLGRSGGENRTLVVSSPSLLGTTIAHLPGVVEVTIEVSAVQPDPLSICCRWPIGAAVTLWQPDSTSHRHLPGDWDTRHPVSSTRSAPVAALIGADDLNLFTVSLSTSVRGCDLTLAVNEESAEAVLNIEVRDLPGEEGRLRLTCRIDTRSQHFAKVLDAVAEGWRHEAAEPSPPVPDVAFMPVFSTWYSDHQHITAERVERHARTAAAYGCGAIIVDDGWHTDNTERGYAYCGDWEPAPTSFPDMAGHVARVHQAGLQYLLWIAPPLIGRNSRAWQRLGAFTIRTLEPMAAAVLDPRFPAVRKHLVESCLRPLRDWGMDGLKVDFIDLWAGPSVSPWRPEMDCTTVEEGAERVLAAVAAGCQELRRQVLVEFRQDYIGPRLRPFGTIIRAADCPMDTVENRVRTIDIRLLARDRAVHSDMLMWHPQATREEIATQFVGSLFATFQVSVDISRLATDQAGVVRHWLNFQQRHAATLLHGELLPSRPDARYTQVVARSQAEVIAVAYSDSYLRLPEPATDRLIIINGTGRAGLIVHSHGGRTYQVTILDCAGTSVGPATTTPAAGPWLIPVPPSGTATMLAVSSAS